jgi:hypothetical protein
MNPLFQKMNFKNQSRILVMYAPISFQPILDEMKNLTQIDTAISEGIKYDFVLAFVYQQDVLDATVEKLATRVSEDVTWWVAYPKQSSKKYKCEFNRDTGWSKFGDNGYEGVRQVAIDEDWSALRFRNVNFVKTLNRESKRALSTEGKKRTEKE